MARKFTKYPSNYIKASSTKIPPICKWVLKEIESGTPIKMPIKLEIIETGYYNKGDDCIGVCIDGNRRKHLTPYVAKILDLRITHATYVDGCMLYPHGADYQFIVDSVRKVAESAGYPDMFDSDYVVYRRPTI